MYIDLDIILKKFIEIFPLICPLLIVFFSFRIIRKFIHSIFISFDEISVDDDNLVEDKLNSNDKEIFIDYLHNDMNDLNEVEPIKHYQKNFSIFNHLLNYNFNREVKK